MTNCDECGGLHAGERTCQDDFHQMLYWENEDARRGVVHHLTVLCYHLQHPGLLSPEWLEEAPGLLADFIERGLTTEEVRRRDRARVSSGKRRWKVAATEERRGRYARRPDWRVRALDVVAAGAEAYVDSVQAWARAVLEDLRTTQFTDENKGG